MAKLVPTYHKSEYSKPETSVVDEQAAEKKKSIYTKQPEGAIELKGIVHNL